MKNNTEYRNNEMKQNLEYRFSGTLESIDKEKRVIHGLAIPVESRSILLGGEFYEVITRAALEGVIENNDVKLYVNHEPSRGTLARSKYGNGSLKLTLTERGLEYETELGSTDLANELYEGIARGDYDQVSFGFVCGEDVWSKNEDGTYTRSINSIQLLDEISCLSCQAAYPATSVAQRSLEAFKEELRAADEKDDEEEKTVSEDENNGDGESVSTGDEVPSEGEETPKDEVQDNVPEEPEEEHRENLQDYYIELRNLLK